VAEGKSSKAECFANALNALLGRLAAGPALHVALIGYRRASDGSQEVGCRWGGPLAGRHWVSSRELAAAPLAVEDRLRKVPGPAGYGVTREETVRFPVWYVPVLKQPGSRIAAFALAAELLGAASDACGAGALGCPDSAQPGAAVPQAPEALKPPLVVHLLAELSSEEGLREAAAAFQTLDASGRAPVVLHAHLGSSSRVPAVLYPSSDANLFPTPLRDLFAASSVLPEPLLAALRDAQLPLNVGARGLIYNARMVDLIRLMALVPAYAAWTPPVAPRAAPADAQAGESASDVTGAAPSPALPLQTTLLVFVLDRSSATPETCAGDPTSAWRRLQDRTSELIGQVARRAQGAIQTAVVSYGGGAGGEPEITAAFGGARAGQTWLPPRDLAEGAVRVEETTEQVSDGIGGLLKIARKRPVFFDLPPAAATSPVPAFERVAALLVAWCEEHRGVQAQPVVVHCTRGALEPDAMREAVARLRMANRATLPAALYHVVVTESSHRAEAYPAAPGALEPDGLRMLWELTSPLANADELARRRPALAPQARGMVVNGAFDLLVDAIGGSG